MKMTFENEIILPLPDGGTLRCGPGEEYLFGGYLRICNAAGQEVAYWDKEEWRRDPELVIGAVFASTKVNVKLRQTCKQGICKRKYP